MIIRSQNKKRIANFKNITEIVCNQGFEILVYFASDIGYSEVFGEYSTEEKAVKVLDMIQNKYFEHITLEQNGTIMGILEKPKVFFMPLDEEVEV